MPYNVLVVDDSQFFKRRLTDLINEHKDLHVVATASNGREAVEKAAELKPDIISMDYEMPVLNGVAAIKEIMQARPVPILMFSSLTYEGARITLDALAAGAVDFIPKDFAEVANNAEQLKQRFHKKLLDIINSHKKKYSGSRKQPVEPKPSIDNIIDDLVIKSERKRLQQQIKLLIIGTSTGGPVALAEVLTKLPASFPLPILLVQHMPEKFTTAFSERLNKLCNIEVKEACDGDKLKPGLALLAPGGKQIMFDPKQKHRIKVLPGDERLNYRPSVDVAFASAANIYRDKVLGLVLTGMGSDGCDGARLLKENGSVIWSQDEASSVIYGMPMAVAKAKLTDKVLSLNEIGSTLAEFF